MGDEANQLDTENVNAQHFTFRELATATKNFRQECLLAEDSFGRVYKGTIPATGQAVAVKQLDRHGTQSTQSYNEFVADVSELSLLHHENLVNLIGYCADGDQRLLVYEFVLGCTLEERLFENKTGQPALNWFERMKVAAGASKGLEYLHESANPPVIYRDLRSSHIMLDDDFNVRLSDFGMIKLSGGDKMNHAPPRIMGTYGYCAPEYVRTGHVTLKSDVYSFGVVLLELITGRRVIDTTRPNEEQNLVAWAQHFFRDPKRYPDMADPLINKQFPEKDLNQAVAIAAMCLQEEAEARPLISDVVTALSFLSMVPPDVIPPPLHPATSISKKSSAGESQGESGSESESESESGSGSGSGSESEESDSSEDEKGKGSKKHDDDTAKTKYQESDVIDIEDDYYKDENPHGSNGLPMFSPKSSRKSSTRTRKGTLSSDSGIGSVSSSSKSGRKSRGAVGNNLSQKKTSRKSSSVSKKSSRKSSTKDLSRGKSCVSRSSVGSEDGDVLLDGSSSRISQGYISFGLTSGVSVQSDLDHNSRTEEESIHLDHECSIGSDEESDHPFDMISSSGSDNGSVHSR